MEKHVKETDVQRREKHIDWQAFEYQAESWSYSERMMVTIGVLLQGCPTMIFGRSVVDGCSASWPTI
ncbi:MAG: hypothetical protein OXE77_07745 [Flavobacteriaceae bacterium]|nr:hypothetical protein [Flavobacteriaceae bacterium]MCY4266455.1 hypothetical protein [Flavobacteriaceae bacterium]